MNRSTPRHWGIFAAVLLSALIFTGCGQRAAKSDSAAPSKSAKVKSSTKEHVKVKSSRPTSSSSKASSSSSTAASAASSQPATPWDSSKDAALTSFVNAWAKTMGQSYAKYDGVHPLKTSVGTTYPTDFSQELVNNTPNLLAWHPDGTGSSSYNVVAIYNYDGTEHRCRAASPISSRFMRGSRSSWWIKVATAPRLPARPRMLPCAATFSALPRASLRNNSESSGIIRASI
ncbi:DUF4767 domain-containing protein [Lacticaseibacillus camelliae]|uniref:DUF4767 domain-containing protein n=1 Tax=Lacticaseibacillus camelliae TaxID=381742 RepID=UPI0009E7220B|nr:DUF4767 domain-containing protein [Lacticaseibacillus camelliae]